MISVPTQRIAGSRQWIVTTALFAALTVLFCGLRSHDNTFDAVSYANQIAHLYPRTGNMRWLLHPHHLLFNLTGYLIWRIASFLGLPVSSLAVLETLNAILGAAGAALYYLSLKRIVPSSPLVALLVTLGTSLTFGYWICATDGRVNMPSTVLMIAAFAMLCRAIETPRRRTAIAAGLLAGCAALYHESAGLFVIVGATAICLMRTGDGTAGIARRRRLLTAYGLTWTAMVAIPYAALGVLALHLHSAGAFHRWMTTYSELGWWWNFAIGHNLVLDFDALRHAVLADRPPHAGGWLNALYWGTAAASLACAVTMLPTHGTGGRPAGEGPAGRSRLVIVCLTWIALYAAFFTVWSPGYFVFWTPTLIPIGVIGAIGLDRARARYGAWPLVFASASVVLGSVFNFQAAILPHHQTGSSPFRRAAADIRAHTVYGDLVIVPGAGDGADCEVDIPYFADRDVLSIHTELTRKRDDKAAMIRLSQAEISSVLSSGHAVYAMDDGSPRQPVRGVWYPPGTWAALLRRHRWTDADEQSLFAPYTLSLAWSGPRGPVWRLGRNGVTR